MGVDINQLPDHVQEQIKGKEKKQQKAQKPAQKAKGSNSHTTSQMNQTEAEYGTMLDAQKRTGEIIDYRFESVNLRLGSDNHYRPDFMVLNSAFEIEFHEVKGGFWREDARVKIKSAAQQYPYFRFLVAQKKNRKWHYEEIKPYI